MYLFTKYTSLKFLSTERAAIVPLFCDDIQAGVIKPHVATTLAQYPRVFECVREGGGSVTCVRLNETLRSVEERTAGVNSVFSDLRDKGVFSCLRGWRNEVCFV